jgi:hypothetical protein
MKKRTNSFVLIHFLIPAALAAAMILAACAPVTGPETSGSPSGKGYVNIALGVLNPDDAEPAASVESAASRALVPGSVLSGAFTSYDLIFTPSIGSVVELNGVTALDEIQLDVGTYSLVLTAYTGSDGAKAEAATGTAGEIVITEGAIAYVTVPLIFKPGAGDGTLSFTVTRPDGLDLSDALFVLTPLGSGTTYGEDWLEALYTDSGGGKPETYSNNETVASGYYRVTITLSAVELEAVKSDIVHIGAGQTTTLNWAFTEADFAAIEADIWLLGVNNEWQTYDTVNKLTKEDETTFVWEGGMSQAYFRFSLESTAGWANDKDRPNRFQPAVDQTVITFGTAAAMTSVSRNTGSTTAWNLGGAGYYRFVVDTHDKTVTVEKPVAVTGVIVKDAGNTTITEISLPQGTADYQFTAVVQGINVESTGVIWAISSGTVAAGTSVADGALTIADDETVSAAFTLTATSVVDDTKSGSVTVTVTSKGAQPLAVPEDVSLSGEGVAEWNDSDDETNVVKYSARLYKNGAALGAAREVEKDDSYSEDFLSAMRSGGVGSYTVKVKAVGDGADYVDSPEVTSNAQTVTQIASAPSTWWIDSTVAHWERVSGSENAGDYTVNVYRDNSKVAATTGAGIYTGEYDKLNAYVDLASIIGENGTGVYKFGVITKGDGALVLDSEESVSVTYSYIAALSAPGKPILSTGAVTWTSVSGASSYTIKLYKEGTAEAVETYTNQTSGASVLATMRGSGAGTYAVTVIAVGDGTAWLSSAESAASTGETVSVLGTPSGLVWDETSAEWTAVANAGSYTVALYKDGTPTDTITGASSPLDLAPYLASEGSYTFTVQATGSSSSLYLDGVVSAASSAKAIDDTSAIITLIPANASGNFTVSASGPVSIGKAGEVTSVALTVAGTAGVGGFTWIVDGNPISSSGNGFTLSGTNHETLAINAADSAIKLGGHSVTVYTFDGNSVPWSPTTPVTVTVAPAAYNPVNLAIKNQAASPAAETTADNPILLQLTSTDGVTWSWTGTQTVTNAETSVVGTTGIANWTFGYADYSLGNTEKYTFTAKIALTADGNLLVADFTNPGSVPASGYRNFMGMRNLKGAAKYYYGASNNSLSAPESGQTTLTAGETYTYIVSFNGTSVSAKIMDSTETTVVRAVYSRNISDANSTIKTHSTPRPGFAVADGGTAGSTITVSELRLTLDE